MVAAFEDAAVTHASRQILSIMTLLVALMIVREPAEAHRPPENRTPEAIVADEIA